MRVINIESCQDCPYKRIWNKNTKQYATGIPKDHEDVCSNYEYTIIPDVDNIPEWCPLPLFTE